VALQQHDAAQQVLCALFPGTSDQVSVLEFACERFCTTGHASPDMPAQFQPGRSFQFIWVASLFSHLPEALFDAWLARRVDCLGSDGVLCFSVHDERLVPPGHGFPRRGGAACSPDPPRSRRQGFRGRCPGPGPSR